MWLDLLSVEKSYFPYLIKEGVNTVLDLRYESTSENMRGLFRVLDCILRHAASSDDKWVFSFVGSPVQGQNLSVLNFFDAHRFEVAFRMTEICKSDFGTPASLTEISFVCSLELLEKFLKNDTLNFAWDFRLGGWLAEKAAYKALVNEIKFNNGFQYPSKKVKLGFCSSEDWDCIQFFSVDEDRLKNIKQVNLTRQP